MITMRKADISIEALFGILMFIIAIAVLFFIFMKARGESSNLLNLIPIRCAAKQEISS